MILRTGIRWLYRIVFWVLFICSTAHFGLKISVPSILLAYNKGLPSNYTIEITGTQPEDCFQWQSANPQIVRVSPIFSSTNCSKKAIVSSIANLLERKVTQVSSVLQGGSGKEFHIDVITDSVTQVELLRLSDELILGGSPQAVTLIGKDKYGHTFTSINGLEVQWQITHYLGESVEPTEDKVIRISKFHSSEYETPEEQYACSWEKRNLFSRNILVQPFQLGTAKISASLLFSSKPVLQAQEISLKVRPNLRIHPSSPVNLLRHASVNVRMEKGSNGKPEDVSLENFETDIEDFSVISMSENVSLLSANKYGSSAVTYKSINKNYLDVVLEIHVVKLNRIENITFMSLYRITIIGVFLLGRVMPILRRQTLKEVNLDAMKGVRISDGDFKTLEEMKIYEVTLDLYDENDNIIYPSDNLRLGVNFPTKLFHVIYTSANGTYSVIQTIAPGSGAIRVEYKGILMVESILKEHAVSLSTDVIVCQKLNIFPPMILLPLLSIGNTFHDVPLMVTGGTGDYVWALSNETVAKLVENENKKNAVRLEIYGQVDLKITVTDRNNVNFISTAQVSVQPPLDIETYPTVVEAEVGNILIIPTALLGYEDKERNIIRKFDDCSKIEPSVEIIDKYVLSHEKESNTPQFGKGCISLQFRCKYAGHTRINIQYTVKTGENSNITHKTTTVLACHKPLKPVQPVRVAVLALGTSKEVAFEGGPRKWPLFKEGHYTELVASDPDLVTIQLIKDPVRYNKDLTVFRVTCKNFGENTLTFKIGNKPSATIQHPAKSEANIKFFCAEPHSLHLKVHKKNSKKKVDEHIVKVPFYGEKIFAVDMWVKDVMGRKFANISSLRVAWDVSDKTLAQPESYFDFMTHENAVAGYRKLSRDFKEFKMTGATGDLKVEAKVTAYRKDVLSKEDINDYVELKQISKEIDLSLVSLRDFNPGLYDDATEKKVQILCIEEGNPVDFRNNEEDYCDHESCSS